MSRRIKVCRHEAAHAVVAHMLGFTVIRIKITGASTGFTETSCSKKTTCPMMLGMVAMAGKCADRRWHRIGRDWFPEGDLRTVKRLGYSWRAIATLEALAMAQVEEHADVIDRVARELKKRDLSAREFRALLK